MEDIPDFRKHLIPTISAKVQEEKIYPPIQLQEEFGAVLLSDQARVRESWAHLQNGIQNRTGPNGHDPIISQTKIHEEANPSEIKELPVALIYEIPKGDKRKSEEYQLPQSSSSESKRNSAPECLNPKMEITEHNGNSSSESQKVDIITESARTDESYDPDIHKYVAETLPIDELVRAPKIGIRHWQIFLYSFVVFIGLGFRVTLSVSIVAMTNPSVSTNVDIPTYPEWNDKSVILSAFFWGYIIPQIFAGWMASRYGPKWFLVGSMCVCSISSVFIPLAASMFGSVGVMICRSVQGFSQGFFFPSLHHVISQWVPTSERSRLGGFVYAANPIGTVVAMVVSGAISSSPLGWPWVFYSYGILGLVWCLVSTFFAYNSPKDCPLVSFAEKAYIENSLGHNGRSMNHRTPWKEIATSLPVWAILVVMFGQNWGFWTLITEIPIYLDRVMNFEIQKNSILSAIPYLTVWILSFGMNYLCDKLIIKNLLSIGAARKVFNSVGLIFPAIALIFLAHTPVDNPYRAIALLVVAIGFNAGTYCGYLVNHIDISPNHAGVLMGITNCLSNISGILAPLTVQFVVVKEDNPEQWKIIFLVTAAIYISANTFFVMFGSGQVQSWNEEDKPRGAKENY